MVPLALDRVQTCVAGCAATAKVKVVPPAKIPGKVDTPFAFTTICTAALFKVTVLPAFRPDTVAPKEFAAHATMVAFAWLPSVGMTPVARARVQNCPMGCVKTVTLKGPRDESFVGKAKVPLLVTTIVSTPLFCSVKFRPLPSPVTVPLTVPSDPALPPPQAARLRPNKLAERNEVVREVFMVCFSVGRRWFAPGWKGVSSDLTSAANHSGVNRC